MRGTSLHHFTHINIPRDFFITVVLKSGLDLGVLIHSSQSDNRCVLSDKKVN